MSAFIAEVKSWQGIGGIPLNNGKIYIGLVGLDPVLNPAPIFSDRGLATPLANPVDIDAFGNPESKIWIPGRYSIKVEDSSGSQILQELDNGEEPQSGTTALDNVQGINAITAEGSPTITVYVDKELYILKIANDNTGPVTADFDGVAVKNVKRNLDQDIVKGQFKQDELVILQYNSTTDQLNWVNENQKVDYKVQGDNIAAAALVDLSLATGNNVSITGSGVPIGGLGTVVAGAVYRLLFPGATPVTITSSSIANPTNILCAAAHGLATGDTVLIEGHSGSVPNINGEHVVTVVNDTNYTIPVNVTTGGTGGTSTGIPSMVNNDTSLILPGGRNETLSPGSTMEVISLGSGNWRAFNHQPPAGINPTGLQMLYPGLLAPSGWILAKGGTIGSATSGATVRANSDTEKLFALYWDSMADAQRPVSTGRGANAAADFAANKTIGIPDMKGKMAVGTGGTAMTTHGDNGGEEKHVLLEAEMPSSLTVTIPTNTSSVGVGSTAIKSNDTAANSSVSVTLTSVGSGTAHENMSPWESSNWIIKL